MACKKNLKTISNSGSGNPITGTLVSIHDAAQNQKIWDWATSLEETNGGAPYWIGIRRDCLGPGCGFEWADFSKVRVAETVGSDQVINHYIQVDYVNWGPGEPNDAGEGEQGRIDFVFLKRIPDTLFTDCNVFLNSSFCQSRE